MKFSKHQKEILKQIAAGNVYDLYSYIKHFRLGKWIKLDSNQILKRFTEDTIPKTVYCAKGLKKIQSNMLTEKQYRIKLNKHELNPDEYVPYEISLRFDTGIQQKDWEGNIYTFDFYKGVLIAKSFSDITDFLVLWQYLKSEMLILEVPQKCSVETLGLFFTELKNKVYQPSLDEQIAGIDLSDFSYSDQSYLGDSTFQLSYEHCIMCKEYLGKKICASTALELFIKKRFHTSEERMQNSALFAAWLAIAVSILLTFAPFLRQNDNADSLTNATDNVAQEIVNFREAFTNSNCQKEISEKVQLIIDKLDRVIDLLSTKESTEDTLPQETQSALPES